MDKDSELQNLPYYNIQYDWHASNPGDATWVSVKKPGADKSVNCNITRGNDGFSGHAPFSRVLYSKKESALRIFDDESNEECAFISPFRTFNQIHSKGLISMDVSNGGLGISVCSQNKVQVWETQTGTIRRTLEGHGKDFETTGCQIFPSGVVGLTTGTDFSLKIWSLETGTSPVQLRGHISYVNDVAILDKGRNIVSISKDGSAKLWDCGESKCLETLFNCGAMINSCGLMSNTDLNLGLPISNSEREIGTEGKVLIMAREDSLVSGICLASRTKIFNHSLPSPGNSVTPLGCNTYAVGCQAGEILVFDLRKDKPLREIRWPNNSPILDLCCHSSKNGTFWAAKNDGTLDLLGVGKRVQLTGSDFSPIVKIKGDGPEGYLYAACKDGAIRKYSFKSIQNVINFQD